MPENNINPRSVAERIRFLMRQQRLTQAEFARRIGLDAANLSKQLNGRLPITKGLINRITADIGVSKRWLLTGKDLPFAKPDTATHIALTETSLTETPSTGTPIYDIDVTAGCTELSREFTADRIIGAMTIPSLSPSAVIVKVNGDSMEPEILNGSYIAIRPITDLQCIFWGQIYVVVLDNFRLVKHLRRMPDPAKICLHSANPLYDDMEIDRDKIKNLYLVEAILNLKIQC